MRCFALLFSFLCLIGTNEVYDFLYVFFCACIAQQALLPSCKHFSPALKDKKKALFERASFYWSRGEITPSIPFQAAW